MKWEAGDYIVRVDGKPFPSGSLFEVVRKDAKYWEMQVFDAAGIEIPVRLATPGQIAKFHQTTILPARPPQVTGEGAGLAVGSNAPKVYGGGAGNAIGMNALNDATVYRKNDALGYVDKHVVSAGAAPSSQNLKADGGKLQWTLVMNGCAKALLGVVKVMTVAITPKPLGRGYAKNSWKIVPEAKERYRDALYRHLAAIERGEIWDDGPEGTGQLHWDCVTTNALFLSEFAHGEHDAVTTNAVPTA